jgi:PadR family transcriptional regulator, regulatory protein PadR
MGEPRMTLQTQLVLRVLLDDPDRQRYGLDLSEALGLPSGTIYPILARLEQVGWVESTWEDPEVHQLHGRPRRRLYRLTQDGASRARAALQRTQREAPGRRFAWPAPAWKGAGS